MFKPCSQNINRAPVWFIYFADQPTPYSALCRDRVPSASDRSTAGRTGRSCKSPATGSRRSGPAWPAARLGGSGHRGLAADTSEAPRPCQHLRKRSHPCPRPRTVVTRCGSATAPGRTVAAWPCTGRAAGRRESIAWAGPPGPEVPPLPAGHIALAVVVHHLRGRQANGLDVGAQPEG